MSDYSPDNRDVCVREIILDHQLLSLFLKDLQHLPPLKGKLLLILEYEYKETLQFESDKSNPLLNLSLIHI